MKTILTTAFEPFGGETINPTGLIIKALPDSLSDAKILKMLLPVEFIKAPQIAKHAIDELCPDAVILLGQAGGRAYVTPERVAINIMDARMPDNAGFMPADEPITPNGAAAYFSTLPIKSITAELKANGIPAEVSNSAGTYVCNALMYGVMEHLKDKALRQGRPCIPAGFIHFPYIRQQAEGKPQTPPFMELEQEILAARLILKTVSHL